MATNLEDWLAFYASLATRKEILTVSNALDDLRQSVQAAVEKIASVGALAARLADQTTRADNLALQVNDLQARLTAAETTQEEIARQLAAAVANAPNP